MLLIEKEQGEIWSYGVGYENKCIVGCDVVQPGRKLPSFEMNSIPGQSTLKMGAVGSSETSVTN